MKNSSENEEVSKLPTSKSLIGENHREQKDRMGQSCILQKLMTKSNPDKPIFNDEPYHGHKSFFKNTLVTETFTSKFHDKKMSESTHITTHKTQLNKDKFLQKYKHDLIFKHLVNRMIKKYEHAKFEEHILFHDQNPNGYTLRLKKVNEQIEEAKMYLKYKKFLNENNA